MSKKPEAKHAPAEASEASEKLRYDCYTVRDLPQVEGEKSRGFWTRIGAGFTNKDGSISLLLDAVPVNGKIVMRIHENKSTVEASE